MISKEEAIAQFKLILGGMSSWVILAKSQFVEHLAIFASWALRDALWKIERAKQEFFLSTALNDASIRAKAEDREYIPRMAIPSQGLVRIVNNGAFISLPENTSFESSSQLLNYLLRSALTIDTGATVDISADQLFYNPPLLVTILESESFKEVLLPEESSQKYVRFKVFVDVGNGFELWDYIRLFKNTVAESKVYDLFFTHGGRIGIRFGNGVFGMALPVNAVVKIEYWTTEGDTTLIAGQTLQLVSDIQGADLTVTTLETITGGTGPESIDEIRKNLHYWQSYNEKIVWGDDYSFFIKKQIPKITWLNCWGEQQQEAETGFSVQNINKIFVSGYAPESLNLSNEILDTLLSVKILNRKFQWVNPLQLLFTVSITGTISRSAEIALTTSIIWDALLANYGPDSGNRLPQVKISDIYRIIKETGCFDESGTHYQVTISGTTAPSQLREMVALDPLQANSIFTLTY